MAISQKITKNWSQWLSLFQKNPSNIWTGFATSDIIQHNNISTYDSNIIRNEPEIKNEPVQRGHRGLDREPRLQRRGRLARTLEYV